MERLTVKLNDGTWALKRNADESSIPLAIDSLAAYEDTGLSPETVSDLLERFTYFYRTVEGLDLVDPVHFGAFVDRVKRWQQAEKDGRLVALPCKVGDMVWCISRAYKTISQYTVAGYLNDGFRWKVRMTKTIPSWVGNKTEHKYVVFNAFGKTVFWTREEAEAALKEREEADNETVR